MLSKYVLRERKGSIRKKHDPPWMDAGDARELSLLTRRFRAARECNAATAAVKTHWLKECGSSSALASGLDGSYFETSSRKSLSSVCLARPLHTCEDQEINKPTDMVPLTSHDLSHHHHHCHRHHCHYHHRHHYYCHYDLMFKYWKWNQWQTFVCNIETFQYVDNKYNNYKVKELKAD